MGAEVLNINLSRVLYHLFYKIDAKNVESHKEVKLLPLFTFSLSLMFSTWTHVCEVIFV